MSRLLLVVAALAFNTVMSLPAVAATSVLVLDCGLNDDTLLPNVPEELARTAAVAPLLRDRLRELGYRVPDWSSSAQMLAETANGYLVAHPEIVADLGRQQEVGWVVVCSQFKFSFLVSILRAHLVDVGSDSVVTHAETWMRGAMTDQRITRRTARSFADQVHELLQQVAAQRKE